MIKDILEAFTNLIVTIKEKPLAALLAFIVLFVSYVAYENGSKIESISRLDPTPQIEHQRFEKALEVNEEINKSIEILREDVGADRVLVRQFHNGRKDLTGIPFTSTTVTYSALGPGVDLSPINYESKPLSSMNRTIRLMWSQENMMHPKCAMVRIDEVKDQPYREALEESGVKKVGLCPMTNLLNYPVGFISVGYMHNIKSDNDKEVLAKVEKVATKTVGFLETITIEEKETNNIFNLFGLLK